MFKCLQSCAFSDKDSGILNFELGKTYKKSEVAAVPKEAFKGKDAFFEEVEEEEVEETETKTTKTTKKGKDEKEEGEDERV